MRMATFTLCLTQLMPPAIIHHHPVAKPMKQMNNEKNEWNNQSDQMIYKPIEESAIASQTKVKTNQHNWLNRLTNICHSLTMMMTSKTITSTFSLFFDAACISTTIGCSSVGKHEQSDGWNKQTKQKSGCSHSVHRTSKCYVRLFIKKTIFFPLPAHTHNLLLG